MKNRTVRHRRVIITIAMLGACTAAQLSGIATVLPTGSIPVDAAIEWSSFEPGVILLQARRGETLALIVADHGDGVDGLKQAFEGPFDDIDVVNGLERFYRLAVRPGSVRAKVRDYLSDPRIERAELISNDVEALFTL